MISNLSLYLAKKYIKVFFIIFSGLIIFYAGFDYLASVKRLPDSANIRLLYVYYNIQFASSLFLPLSLIFGMIVTKVLLIRSNELVALYSMGYSKWDVLRPFIFVSMFITFLFIFAHTTKYAYAKEYASNIYSTGSLTRTTKDLFFKYKNYYIYMETLNPIANKGDNLHIFNEKNRDIITIIRAKEAFYRDNRWVLPNAKQLTKKKEIEFGKKITDNFETKNIEILEGFKPAILDHIHQGKITYSINDAIQAIILLHKQKSDTNKIYTALYTIMIYPFFAPLLIFIIFFFVPISSRLLNISLFSFLALLISLIIWGILFVLKRLSEGEILIPEVGIIAPIFIIFLAAITLWFKEIYKLNSLINS